MFKYTFWPRSLPGLVIELTVMADNWAQAVEMAETIIWEKSQ